ncbi:MAG TPA: PilZ domain-containing protein [Planctomycetota bacterium]|nr:PilZ domain-containing protein [Planctomycetota bacterium]
MESTQQRRLHKRASARLPVWVKRAATGVVLQGHTANVSAGGMYLLTAVDREFFLGVEVTVVFGIRDEDHGGYVLHEPSRGAEVVRVERHGYGTGIAVKFTESSFARCVEAPMLS